jgi:hypothetical protein
MSAAGTERGPQEVYGFCDFRRRVFPGAGARVTVLDQGLGESAVAVFAETAADGCCLAQLLEPGALGLASEERLVGCAAMINQWITSERAVDAAIAENEGDHIQPKITPLPGRSTMTAQERYREAAPPPTGSVAGS